jgi:Reverse transcriptase (RNA-dependent DNA polymerase)
VYGHVYDGDRQKMDPKAWRGVMLGYDEHNSRCYRVLDVSTGKIRHTVHVTFDERTMPFRVQNAAIMNALRSDGKFVEFGDVSKPVGAITQVGANGRDEHEQQDEEHENREEDEDDLRGTWRVSETIRRNPDSFGRNGNKSLRIQNQNDRLSNDQAYVAISSDIQEPRSYAEAMSGPHAAEWKKAQDEEYNAQVANDTWELVPVPEGKNVIGCKWVYKVKLDEHNVVQRLKGRDVVVGKWQIYKEDYDETFAPVAKPSSIRAVIAVAAVKGMVLENLDVDTAFLQSKVEEEVYVEQPRGYEVKGPNGEKLVRKLKKSLYGLKQAPRNWNKTFDEWIRKLGFEPSQADQCVYVMVVEGSIIVVILYVDDMIIAGDNQEVVDRFKKDVAKRFKVKELGGLRWILGMEVIRDTDKMTIEIKQTAYIDKILARFGMSQCKPVSTPMEKVLRRAETGDDQLRSEYMKLVGSILYPANMTRPDIMYPSQSLARNMQSPSHVHFTAGKRVIRYLMGTRDEGIIYGVGDLEPVIYVDASWGDDPDTGRSTTGYVVMMAGGAISWGSKLQQTVALSSTEAEYMALCAATQEAIHVRRLVGDLGIELKEPTIIYEDNQGCIAISKNPVDHKRTKHINLRYHFTRERIESGDIKVEYMATEHQLADLMTKPLMSHRLETLRKQVMGSKTMSS